MARCGPRWLPAWAGPPAAQSFYCFPSCLFVFKVLRVSGHRPHPSILRGPSFVSRASFFSDFKQSVRLCNATRCNSRLFFCLARIAFVPLFPCRIASLYSNGCDRSASCSHLAWPLHPTSVASTERFPGLQCQPPRTRERKPQIQCKKERSIVKQLQISHLDIVTLFTSFAYIVRSLCALYSISPSNRSPLVSVLFSNRCDCLSLCYTAGF